MTCWPLRWIDPLTRENFDARWVGGHVNSSQEAAIEVDEGLHIRFQEGTEYAGAGIVTRQPLAGDFDARVRFKVESPRLGTTFELAAITIDPPRESAFDQAQANEYSRSRVYEVHGAPPYVSAEFDEADGARIGWNRGSAQTVPQGDAWLRQALSNPNSRPQIPVISDNHFNRYGRNIGPKPQGAAEGWLRLVRSGPHWSSYYLDPLTQEWQLVGQVLHMNMPEAVYLRLAAKHWSKKGAPAPANQVTLHDFELRGAAPAPSDTQLDNLGKEALMEGQNQPIPAAFPPAPPEIRLVHEVRACRLCKALHSDSPYGPFAQVAESLDLTTGNGPRQLPVEDLGRPEPTVLHGCRKAPVMLIGINPNLPGHFVMPRSKPKSDWKSGSYRLITRHASDTEYAVAHRFAPQNGLEIDQPADLESLLRDDLSLLVAPKAGVIVPEDPDHPQTESVSSRERMHRKARLVLKFDDGECRIYDFEWPAERNFVVVRGRFKAGDVIAGYIDTTARDRFAAVLRRKKTDSYYLNAQRLLAGMARHLDSAARLELGEDMSLHDAVACASPNWNASGLPLDLIGQNCISRRSWLHQQIAHSVPLVLLVTSQEALKLLARDQTLGTLDPGELPLPKVAGGKQGLFAHVARHGMWWNQTVAGRRHRIRVVLAPHISYSDNINPQCYFSGSEWAAFKVAHAAVVTQLEQSPKGLDERIKVVRGTDNGANHLPDVSVYLDNDCQDGPLWQKLAQLDGEAVQELRDHWFDPVELLSQAVSEELLRQQVRLDAQGHLQRSAGPCAYCDNPWWKIGNGCAYGVAPM